MASIFSSPKMPKAPEPIKTPIKDDAMIVAEQQDKFSKRQGKASTILSTQSNRTQSASKTLLGQ